MIFLDCVLIKTLYKQTYFIFSYFEITIQNTEKCRIIIKIS